MGVTKQYLRFAPGPVFGVVASHTVNAVTLHGEGSNTCLCAVGACENVYIWDVNKKEKVITLKGEKSRVTCLAKSPQTHELAVGYEDGSIKIFDIATAEYNVNFQGHKSAVTALQFDDKGVRLVSGSKDTDVIVWDVVSESGLFRLKGHKKEITKVAFMKHRNLLVTSSKDTLIKFWDLETQHCFYTVVGHRTEVYGFLLLRDETRLITGSADSELRIWDIQYLEDDEEGSDKQQEGDEPPIKRQKVSVDKMETDDDDAENDVEDEEQLATDEAMKILKCKKVGAVLRNGRDRLVTLCTDPLEKLLFCHGTDKHLEVFHLPTPEELAKVKGKRMKKIRKKQLDTGTKVDLSGADIKITDEVKFLERFRFSARLCCVDSIIDTKKELKFCALLANNKLESGMLSLEKAKLQLHDVVPLAGAGHRTDVRTLSISLDNTAILSASAEEVKLWNRDSLQCVRTMSCGYALCSLFVPGDKHVLIGTKDGKLQLFEVNNGSLLETFDAHSGTLWSIAPMPDQRGIISGGADQEVKFWNYELISDSDRAVQHKVLTLEHTKTLKMDEEVLSVLYSPNQKLIAVALLDNTVKVFFADTLKFFLSLYGHKLPVVCMDISSDSTLIITGSADRNIKIWGLDFGDCHRSIFAHDDSITCIQFVSKTHLFFSGGKDRCIKQWDADNFENILTLKGHLGEVRCLAISPSGNTVVSSAHDHSIRLWEKTEEPLILEEEKEEEREREEMESLLKDGEEVVPGETTEEVKMAGKKTMETIKGTERLMEAVEIYDAHMEALAQAAARNESAPAAHPMMVAYKCSTPSGFILETIRRIKSSDMQGTLLSLPFSYVTRLLPVLDGLLKKQQDPELVCKCLNFLLKIHQGEITSNHVHLPILERLKENATQAVQRHRDLTAFNMAGLAFLKKGLEESKSVMLFADATGRRKEKKKKKAMLVVK